MSTTKILPLTQFRGRRQRRHDLTRALHVADRHRGRLLHHLWRALDVVGADRAAAVWIDEYGPGLVHPHAVLDVAFDHPRTGFSGELLRLTWGKGVPGVLDATDPTRLGNVSPLDSPRSAFVVSLGSDGLRAWFMVVDSLTPRPALQPEAVEDLLFLAGECAGVLLHRDMDDGPADRHVGAWPILRDGSGGSDGGCDRRVACRFVVARAVRAYVDDELVAEPEELEERVAAARAELTDVDPEDPERKAWEAVLEALRTQDRHGLADALFELARTTEDRGHWHGAAQLLEAARDVATATGRPDRWIDATRALGRVFRKRGEWDDALHWYGHARDVSRTVGDTGREALALDGLATVHIVRGNVPAARRVLDEALPVADASGEREARAAVYHSLMTVAHTGGQLEEAAHHGWRAVREYGDEEGRLRALTALGGVFLEARELAGAEDAFAIVAARVRDHVFRLYALAGLALVEAHRGRREAYRRRLGELDDAGFASGPPELRAEVLLECGDGFLVLGDDEEARRWYRRAVEVASDEGVNEYLIRAEEALARLDRFAEDAGTREADRGSAELERPELDEIRVDLSRLRRETIPAG